MASKSSHSGQPSLCSISLKTACPHHSHRREVSSEGSGDLSVIRFAQSQAAGSRSSSGRVALSNKKNGFLVKTLSVSASRCAAMVQKFRKEPKAKGESHL